jgi:molybdopterin/thiamine biosynthesis adenylyltransferase
VSLIQAEPPSRTIRLWRGQSLYLLAETDAELQHWLLNRFGKKPDGFNTDAAAFLWLGTAPVPHEYPSTGQELRALAAQAVSSASALLTDLVRNCPQEMVTVLGMDTANGPALAGVMMSAPSTTRYGARAPLTKGFRPDAVPGTVLLARYFGGAKLRRRSIERADAAWIHGRGQDPRAARLRMMRVAVVGCGSLGAPVAIALAQAGVGHLILIDPDTLGWANIGRHRLGASCVGQGKAKALAEKIRADFPHVTVDYRNVDIDLVVRLHTVDLDACDLIVSATGSWAADGRLDAWHAETGRRVPVVYAWMEAHACAGHAVLLGASDGCLRCGFDKTGLPKFRVTAWANGATERQEPACGAVYQPYGPVELGFVNSLTAELALDALRGRERRDPSCLDRSRQASTGARRNVERRMAR